MTIIDALHNVERSFRALLAPSKVGVIAFYNALLHNASNLPPVFFEIVADTVKAVEKPGQTGDQKRAAAFAAISLDVATQLIPAGISDINGAIEAAVAAMKMESILKPDNDNPNDI